MLTLTAQDYLTVTWLSQDLRRASCDRLRGAAKARAGQGFAYRAFHEDGDEVADPGVGVGVELPVHCPPDLFGIGVGEPSDQALSYMVQCFALCLGAVGLVVVELGDHRAVLLRGLRCRRGLLSMSAVVA